MVCHKQRVQAPSTRSQGFQFISTDSRNVLDLSKFRYPDCSRTHSLVRTAILKTKRNAILNIRKFYDVIICSLVHREQRIGANRCVHLIKSSRDSSVSAVIALYTEHPRKHGFYCQQSLSFVLCSKRPDRIWRSSILLFAVLRREATGSWNRPFFWG